MRTIADHHRADRGPGARSSAILLAPIEKLAAKSDNLFTAHLQHEDAKGNVVTIPRFLFTGPGDRGSFLRVGIFAGVHGDELSGPTRASSRADTAGSSARRQTRNPDRLKSSSKPRTTHPTNSRPKPTSRPSSRCSTASAA